MDFPSPSLTALYLWSVQRLVLHTCHHLVLYLYHSIKLQDQTVPVCPFLQWPGSAVSSHSDGRAMARMMWSWAECADSSIWGASREQRQYFFEFTKTIIIVFSFQNCFTKARRSFTFTAELFRVESNVHLYFVVLCSQSEKLYGASRVTPPVIQKRWVQPYTAHAQLAVSHLASLFTEWPHIPGLQLYCLYNLFKLLRCPACYKCSLSTQPGVCPSSRWPWDHFFSFSCLTTSPVQSCLLLPHRLFLSPWMSTFRIWEPCQVWAQQ